MGYKTTQEYKPPTYEHKDYTESYEDEDYKTTHDYKPVGSYRSKRSTYGQGGYSAKPYGYSPSTYGQGSSSAYEQGSSSTYEQGSYEESYGNDGYSMTSDYKPVSYGHEDYTTTHSYKPSGSYRSKRPTYRQEGYEEPNGNDGYSTT